VNGKETLIVIQKISSNFGAKEFTAKAHSYKTEEEMRKIELKHILKRNFGEEKVAEKAVPEAKKENKTEDKKEEAKDAKGKAPEEKKEA